MSLLERLLLLLFVGAALTFGYIDLEVGFAAGSHWVNAPVVDVFAIGFLLVWCWRVLRRQGSHVPWPGGVAYVGFCVVALVSALCANAPFDATHDWLRKIVFYYAAFGVAISHWVATRGAPANLLRALTLGIAVLASVSVVTSLARWGSGATLWHVSLDGLTPNHKTLAVALAPCLPLLLGWREQVRSKERKLLGVVIGLLVIAVGLSASKAAWICLAFGALIWFPRPQRAIGWRWKWAVPFVVCSLAAALYLPVLMGSKAMLDSARSRHSLNVRTALMLAQAPAFGAGPGSSVEVEMVEFPHYRINGVDAHGVVQKIAGETGVLGLAAYGLFAATVLITAARRRRCSVLHAGAAGTLVALHLNLLLSTETFSPTHWFVFAVCWGLLYGPGTRGEA